MGVNVMSIMQRLTLIGLYNYDSKLFDNLTLPDSYDKNTFIESLLIEHGEKLVLYSDYDFMKYSIGAWGRKWSMELTRIAEALMAEYNPIWNYDRYEEWKDKSGKRGMSQTDTATSMAQKTKAGHTDQSETNTTDFMNADVEGSHKLKNDTDYQDKQTNNYDTTTENVTNGTTEHQVSADNSSTYQPESKDITDIGKNKVSNTGTLTHDITGTKEDISERNKSKSETEETGNSKTKNSARDSSETSGSGTDKTSGVNTEAANSDHVGHMWGNIGVTTAASMVTEVTEQRMKYNLYEVACRLFANELLIGIY